jgi:NADH-quinone oxidoreductase subunit F
LAHITKKQCPAGVCKELVGAPCQNACPLDTEAWRYVAHIARGEYEDAYRVIREANPFPSICARVCSHPCEQRCRAGTTGGQAIAIRALKRFITDRIDPTAYKPKRVIKSGKDLPEVAVVGSGPAGLSAAHYLSLKGYRVTIFEKANQPGGMLNLCIPAYRMPRDIIHKEIDAILDKNITLKCDMALGADFSLDSLFQDGYKAVFLALGAHKSRLLKIEGEDVDGVYPAIDFLKGFNVHGQRLSKGHVGIIGGGDSAVDAARVALRSERVKSVTIFYRRTREEMPALAEEVEAALLEGVSLKTLVSPIRILSEKGRLSGVEFISNDQGEVDASGRRKPVPSPGTEHTESLDTLIVTIGDVPDIQYVVDMGVDIADRGTIEVDLETMITNRPGVFAGGDVVRGPNTVVEAIADGKKAAVLIDRYLNRKPLEITPEVRLPKVYIEPIQECDGQTALLERVEGKTISMQSRKGSLAEVELTLTERQAKGEALRCMRCDLEFTAGRKQQTKKSQRKGVKSA